MKQQPETRAQTGNYTAEATPEQELVNYVFAKIRDTWGEAMFEKYVASDVKTLLALKSEWGKDLLRAIGCRRSSRERVDEWILRSKDRVDRMFSDMRIQVTNGKQNWDFPSIRRVCSFMAHYVTPPEHRIWRSDRALPNKAQEEAAKAAGEVELAKMKKMLGVG